MRIKAFCNITVCIIGVSLFYVILLDALIIKLLDILDFFKMLETFNFNHFYVFIIPITLCSELFVARQVVLLSERQDIKKNMTIGLFINVFLFYCFMILKLSSANDTYVIAQEIFLGHIILFILSIIFWMKIY